MPTAGPLRRSSEAKHGFNPDLYGFGYGAVQLIKHAIEKAKSTDAEAMRQALLSTHGLQGVEGTYDFEPNGDAVHGYNVVRNERGEDRFLAPDRLPRAVGNGQMCLPFECCAAAWIESLIRATMAYFLQQLINGLTLGSMFGLIAIGYTMVYGIIGMINFAHGDIFMIGGFVAIVAFMTLGLAGITWMPLALLCILILAMAFTALHGWTVERIAYRPLRGSNRLAPLISAIGMSIFLQNYVQLLQGARNKALPPVIHGSIELMNVDGFTVHLGYLQIVIMLLTVVLMIGLTLLITRTSLGRQQRACEQDMKMAALLGVDVDRTIALTFVMGAGLAAVAGLVWLMYYGVIDFFVGFMAGIKAFTAAVLGGIGSLPGAMLGGILIGLIDTFWAGYFSNDYKDVATFAILVLVLIFRPTGLLGKSDVEKV